MSQNNYFSISSKLVVVDEIIPYDLFVNSSALEGKHRYVRIFPKGEVLSKQDLDKLVEKYLQLYIPETQRSTYMQSLLKSDQIDDVGKTTVIKDSAITHLHNIFESGKEFSTELLSETVEGCRESVEGMIDVLDDYTVDSLRGLIGSLSFHDFYTFDHSINVSMYSILILKNLKKDATRLELMHAGLGGLLHDLGKVKIATHILNNPSKLSEEEYDEIKKHPRLGVDLLLSGECEVAEDIDLETIARVVYEHHENWNGKGYPEGIKEKEIHILARICAIADFFDAITTKRPYNNVLPISHAIDIMGKTAGIKIDPKIFNIFKKHIKHSKITTAKNLRMSDSFDPSIPWEHLPIEEVEEMMEERDMMKIRLFDRNKK